MDALDALALYALPLYELLARADAARREGIGEAFSLCTIINARSGHCSEDCKFCAQSAHYATAVPTYPLVPLPELLEGARRAQAIGSGHFGIVTSGCTLTDAEVDEVVAAVAAIRQAVGINVCASLGCLTYAQLVSLRDAGLVRYHHNLETSRRFFPQIVTTHSYEARVETIQAAHAAGLSVCSGGIIGLGETREDRIEMALALRDLNVDSVPINVLVPIAGTPLAGLDPLSPVEVLKTVAIYRLLLPEKTIKLAAGRESVLKDFQGMAFLAGANSMIIGGYLTQRGRAVEDDQRLVAEVVETWRG
jgi:biotin synthase